VSNPKEVEITLRLSLSLILPSPDVCHSLSCGPSPLNSMASEESASQITMSLNSDLAGHYSHQPASETLKSFWQSFVVKSGLIVISLFSCGWLVSQLYMYQVLVQNYFENDVISDNQFDPPLSAISHPVRQSHHNHQIPNQDNEMI